MKNANRRTFLKTALASTAAAAFTGSRTFAEAPKSAATSDIGAPPQGAGFYRHALGQFELTLISDGFFPAPPNILALNASQTDLEAELQHRFLDPSKEIAAHINTLFIKAPGMNLLVDTGSPQGAFGPGAAQFHANMVWAGLSPDQVDAVFLTHLHPDHVGGLLDTNGASRFPKAELHFTKLERDFWAGNPSLEKMENTDEMKNIVRSVASSILDSDAGKKAKLVSTGDKLMEGVEVLTLPGHTGGHAALRLASGGESMLFISDLIHAPTLQLRHPEWYVAFDAEPAKAVESRKLAFEQAAADRVLIAGSHIPFPAFGHLRREGEGYEWEPVIWSWS